MFFINAISGEESKIMVYWHAKIPNKQNVKHIYAGILSGFLFFYFCDA